MVKSTDNCISTAPQPQPHSHRTSEYLMLVVNACSKVVVINFGQMGPERKENAGQNYVFGKIHCTAADLCYKIGRAASALRIKCNKFR